MNPPPMSPRDSGDPTGADQTGTSPIGIPTTAAYPSWDNPTRPVSVPAGPNWTLVVIGAILALVSLAELGHFAGIQGIDSHVFTPEGLTALGVALVGLGVLGSIAGRHSTGGRRAAARADRTAARAARAAEGQANAR